MMCTVLGDSSFLRIPCTSFQVVIVIDRLCGPVVRVLGCSPRGSGFDSMRYQIFCVAVDLERGPCSFVKINEELLEGKIAAPL
jgi:hypothetical protein